MAVKNRNNANRKQQAALKLKRNAVNMKAKSKAMDARLKINAIARKKTLNIVKTSGDARDVLAHKMKQVGDARAILEKSRNLKKGINDIKTTKKGGIQIVTTTKGKLQLTTKKKIDTQAKKSGGSIKPATKVTKIGKNLTKSIAPSGQVSFSTKPKTSALSASASAKRETTQRRNQPAKAAPSSRPARPARPAMSRAARLDGKFILYCVELLIHGVLFVLLFAF